MGDSPERIGRYVIVKQVASSREAEVFLAHQFGGQGFVKQCVLKCLAPERRASEEERTRFFDEAKVSALMSHPHLVHTYDFGEADDIPFISMEHVEGVTLTELRERTVLPGKPFPLGACLDMVIQVSDALGYAHALKDVEGKSLNLVHRDVSPENILLSQQWGVKLTDFGTSKHEQRLMTTQHGSAPRGTPGYMAPERALGGPEDGRTDLFSLGVVIAELLSGEAVVPDRGRPLDPFQLQDRIQALLDAWPDVPEAVADLVKSMTAIDPEQRPSNARVVSERCRGLAEEAAPNVGITALVVAALARSEDEGEADDDADEPEEEAARSGLDAPAGVGDPDEDEVTTDDLGRPPSGAAEAAGASSDASTDDAAEARRRRDEAETPAVGLAAIDDLLDSMPETDAAPSPALRGLRVPAAVTDVDAAPTAPSTQGLDEPLSEDTDGDADAGTHLDREERPGSGRKPDLHVEASTGASEPSESDERDVRIKSLVVDFGPDGEVTAPVVDQAVVDAATEPLKLSDAIKELRMKSVVLSLDDDDDDIADEVEEQILDTGEPPVRGLALAAARRVSGVLRVSALGGEVLLRHHEGHIVEVCADAPDLGLTDYLVACGACSAATITKAKADAKSAGVDVGAVLVMSGMLRPETYVDRYGAWVHHVLVRLVRADGSFTLVTRAAPASGPIRLPWFEPIAIATLEQFERDAFDSLAPRDHGLSLELPEGVDVSGFADLPAFDGRRTLRDIREASADGEDRLLAIVQILVEAGLLKGRPKPQKRPSTPAPPPPQAKASPPPRRFSSVGSGVRINVEAMVKKAPRLRAGWQLNQALQALEQSIEADPDAVDAKISLAYLRFVQRKPAGGEHPPAVAESTIKEIVPLMKGRQASPTACLILGRLYALAHKPSASKGFFDKLLVHEPDNEEAKAALE